MNIKLPVFFGLILIFLSTVVVETFDLYYRFSHLDTVFHFVGGFIAAWFTFAVVSKQNRPYSKFQVFGILLTSVFTIGWLWELAEYISSVYSPVYAPVIEHYFFIGGWVDTLTDVFIGDLPGALLFCTLYLSRLNRIKN